MTHEEVLRLALEALEAHADIGLKADKAITAIKAALEAKDEPAALKPCAYESKEKKMCRKCGQVHAEAIWYTAPPQRKPLTDEEINAFDYSGTRIEFVRAIEAAHGIKGEA